MQQIQLETRLINPATAPYSNKNALNTMPTTTARLEARIRTELHNQLKHAPEIQGRSMTDFVISATQEAGIVNLSISDQERFAQALLSPPKPTQALKRTFARRQKLLSGSCVKSTCIYQF